MDKKPGKNIIKTKKTTNFKRAKSTRYFDKNEDKSNVKQTTSTSNQDEFVGDVIEIGKGEVPLSWKLKRNDLRRKPKKLKTL